MDDLETLSRRDLIELCRKRTAERDHLEAAMRAAIEEIDIDELSHWAPRVVKSLLTNALNGLEQP